jgi:acylphosphatase
MEAAAHIIVVGLVQGVGYRWFVARHAQSLALSGHVRNLYDGTVEVLAEGDRSAVQELIRHLKVGPRSAHVSDLRISWVEPTSMGGEFEIR